MRKLVSLFLVFILIISSIPFAAGAQGEDDNAPDAAIEQTEGNEEEIDLLKGLFEGETDPEEGDDPEVEDYFYVSDADDGAEEEEDLPGDEAEAEDGQDEVTGQEKAEDAEEAEPEAEPEEEPEAEPAAEAEEEPEEEPAAEAEEEPEEEPEAEAEEEPEEEPAAEAEEETAEEAAEEGPVHFEQGYIRVKKQTKVYAKADKSEETGVFAEDAFVYAVSDTKREDPGKDWLKIRFATERDGETVIAEGFIQAENMRELTEAETASLTAVLEKDSQTMAYQGYLLPVVKFEEKEEATETAVSTEETEPAEAPAEEAPEADIAAAPAEEAPEADPAEAPAEEAPEADLTEAPAEETPEADPAEAPAEEAPQEKPAEAGEAAPIVPEAQAEPETKAETESAESAEAALPEAEKAEEDEAFEEYNECDQTPVDIPENLLPAIDDPDDHTGDIVENGVTAPTVSAQFIPKGSSSLIYITWTDSISNIRLAKKYELQRKTGNGSWITIASRWPVNHKEVGSSKGRFTYFDRNIKTGYAYSYRVKVYRGKKLAAVTAGSRVAALRMSTVSTAMATQGYWNLIWKRVAKADGYFVYRKLSSQKSFPSKPHAIVPSGWTTWFTDTNVTAGKTYKYLVVPFRKVGKYRYAGTYKNVVKCFVGLKKTKITGISQDNTGVTLQWNPVERAKGYQIFMLQGSTWVKVGTVEGRKHTTFKHKTSVTPGTSGTLHQYKVRAIGPLGSKTIGGEMSYARTIRRLASPGPITLKKANAEDYVNVSWKKVTGATKYYVYYRQSGADKFTKKTVSGSKTSASIKAAGTKDHEVYVVAYADKTISQKTTVKHIKPYWYYVLLVGEYDYWDGNKDLPGSKYDVDGMYKLFSKQTKKITRRYNVTADGMRSAISSAFGSAGPNSVCVLMFAGHGMTTNSDYLTASLCFSNGSYITPWSLKYYMDNNVKSEHVVIMLGSCGSGGFIQYNGGESEPQETEFDADAFNNAFISAFSSNVQSNAAEFLYSTKYTVITAAKVHEEGWSWWWHDSRNNPINGYTEIFRALARAGGYDYCSDSGKVTGWISKRGDSNGDKVVTVKEAYNYAKSNVPSSHPQFWSSEPSLILFQ